VDIVSQFADLGVAVAGIVAAGWASAKWLRRPQFICGIPPSIRERPENFDRRRLGHDSVATAFQHEEHCFAERFQDPHQEKLPESLESRLLEDPERTRTIVPDERGHARMPILIVNRGKRLAEYSASITFYADEGQVHVTDVVTETLPVYLYADKPDLVVDRERLRCAHERIVAGYDGYLMDEDMHRWGDVVVLTGGRLEASLFELVVVDVMIDHPLPSFFVVFSVDCTDGWIGAQTFIQGCRIKWEGAAEGSPAEASVPQAATS
jgi:hypothetical protein